MKIDVQAIVDRRAAALRAMVDRFLRWKLPKDFHPDAGISFTPIKPYEGDEYGNSWWPIGTNLFSADQAAQMFRDCIPPECLDDCSSNQLTEVTTERDALQGEIDRLRAAVQGPYGYATWQEAATAERVRRVKAESVATIAHAERDALQLSVHRLVDDLVVVTAAAADAETERDALRTKYDRAHAELLAIHEIVCCGYANVLRHPIMPDDTMTLRGVKVLAADAT